MRGSTPFLEQSITTTQHQVIHLGRLADADTDESSPTVENSAVYLQSFGSAGDPLKDHLITADFVDGDSDGGIETDNGAWTGNYIDYDVGFGQEAHALDSLAVADVDVRSVDGTVVSYSNVVVFQTTRGDLFLANSDFAGTDIQTGTGGIEAITITSIDSNYSGVLHNNFQNFVCFSAETLIKTACGEAPVQSLVAGDRVWTLDHGLQSIVWSGARTIRPLASAMPVRISRGALGQNMPRRSLVVSPQHRVFVRSRIAQRLFGTLEVLIAAKFLTDLPGIDQLPMHGEITYCHIMLGHHQVISPNGALMESFHPGSEALKTLPVIDVMRVRACVSTLDKTSSAATLARPVLSGAKRRKLIACHVRHGRRLAMGCKPSVGYSCTTA